MKLWFNICASISCLLFTALAAHAAAPPNDNFANRITLTGAIITTTGSNVEATRQVGGAGEPQHAGNGGKSVWWTWTATLDGPVSINTFGSTFDTVLAVYTGSALNALTLVANNNDANGTGQSAVGFTGVAGTAYQIAVAGNGGQISAPSGDITLTLTSPVAGVPVTLIPTGVPWRYLDDGLNAGTAWRAPAYDDTAWPTGPAELGYGDGDETTQVRSNRLDTTRIVTTYFRQTFVITNLSELTDFHTRLLRDDGAVVYLNGVEAFRDGMPSGAIAFDTFATATIGGADELAYVTNAINPALLVEGTNLLAVEIHQVTLNSSDVSFNLGLHATRLASNAPPAVALTAPAHNTTFAAPATVSLAADASDSDGAITRVQFLQGATPLGEDTVSPFTLTWNNVIGGTYSLRAIATDNFGARATSAVVSITVTGNVPPTVSLAAPAQGALFTAPAEIPLSATVGDLDGSVTRVEFFANGQSLGADLTSPFSFNWSGVSTGGYALTAVATDNGGISATSAVINVTVSPPSTATTNTLIALGSVWKYLDNGSDQGTAWAAPAFNDTAWAAGPAPLGYGDNDEATVVGFGPDPQNKYITTWFRRTFSVSDATLVTNLTVRALRDDGVAVYLNGTEILRDNLPGGAITYTTLALSALEDAFATAPVPPGLLVNGANVLAVEIHQAQPTSSDISFDLELIAETGSTSGNLPPTLSLIRPANHATFLAPTVVPLEATAADSDGQVALVEFFADSTRLGGDSSSPFQWSWTNAVVGAFTVTAVATDNGGATRTSDPIQVTFTGEGPTTLIATGSVWKFLDTGEDAGTAWVVAGYNDSAWISGPAELGYGDGGEATVVNGNRISDGSRIITTYFRRAFNVPDPARFSYLTLRLKRDDGGVIYLNGVEIFRSNMPSGPVNYLTLAPSSASDDGATFLSTSVSVSQLVAGNNVVAVEIHQNAVNSSDISFDLELIGETGAINNASPFVGLTSPGSNATFTEPANITINASASDSDGTIRSVDFYQNGLKLASVSNAPYSTFWSGVPIGSYALTAVAFDNLGGVATSAVVNVFVTVSSAPTLAAVNPAAGTVHALTQTTVTFTEPVMGVNATDLLVNGLPATGVSGSGAVYAFTFPPPEEGLVAITWAASHGIVDFETPPKPFDALAPGAFWQYTLVDTVPPTVLALSPAAGSTIRALTEVQVTFSEAVSGVNAADLLINSGPATSVSGYGAGPYVFQFPPPAAGPVTIAWAGGHGIQDFANTANPFGGGTWNYTLNAAAAYEGRVVINEFMYHPTSHDSREEYIELLNTTVESVNLTGWQFNRGIFYTFSNVTMAPGSYLVIAADVVAFQSKYPGVANVIGGWQGVLSNSRENVELVDALGDRVDQVSYADEGDWAIRQRGPLDNNHRGWEWFSETDGLGKSVELRNPALSNNQGQNWSPSLVADGTPGVANSVASSDIAPMILDVTHFPAIPKSTEPVAITARIVNEQAGGPTVTLRHRNASSSSPPAFSSTTMLDDGLNSDGAAADGVYGVVLPALPNGTVIEFYLEASDATSNVRTWPAAARQTDGSFAQTANALYQIDDGAYAGSQPIYRLIMTEEERLELNGINRQSNAEMNATFITMEGPILEVRHNVGVRIRGAGSRGAAVPNWRVNIPTDRLWNDVNEINLNAQFVYAQVAGSALSLKAGLPAANARLIQVRLNGVNTATSGSRQFGSYVLVEVLNGDWAERQFPEDGNGNVYRCTRPNTDLSYLGTNPQNYLNTGYSKASNASENDWSDLINLTSVLNNAPDSTYVPQMRQTVNVEAWMRYFAVCAMLEYSETALCNGVGDDYSMYRGEIDPRFRLLPHDYDTVLGQGDTSGNPNENIFIMTSLPNLNRFMRHPEFVPIYYAALKQLIDTTFSAAELNPLLDQLLTGIPEGTIASMKSFAANRVAGVLSQIPLALTVNTTLPVSGGYFFTTSASIALNGQANVIHTRSVRVNGSIAGWTAWQGAWSLPNLVLQPGVNHVLVQSLDANGQELERRTLEVWYDDGNTTSVSGNIATSRTWTAAAGPYVVTANVTVPAGVTLTIEPGTTIYFAQGTSLTVNGRLLAEGTADRRIRFTRAPGTAATWDGLRFNNSAQENRITYANVDFSATGDAVTATSATILIDNVVFSGTTRTIIELSNASAIIRNSVFPTIVDNEVIHGNGMPAGGYVIVEGNYFGGTTGYSDIIDFTGGQRPGPILQVLNNVFDGGSDDALDLDGTDAHIEGNLFRNIQQDAPRDSAAHAIATDFGAEITVVRNVFYNNDHAVLLKNGAFLTAQNNTIVGSLVAAISFDETNRVVDPGRGASLDGNILWGNAALFLHLTDPVAGAVELTVNHSILQGTNWPGLGNLSADPFFVDGAGDFHLQAGSPAIGTGPNGLDMGAYVPAGASISGEPSTPTSLTSATLTVRGPGITHYRYKLNNGAYGPETAIDSPIALTGLANGTYTVLVIGKNSAGVWQSLANATVSRTWTVNAAFDDLRLNEVLARNVAAVTHSGTFPDLVELHNAGGAAIDLSGMRLTDDPFNPDKFAFPNDTSLAAGGYLVLYANDPDGSPGLHLGFSLGQEGETLYLFDRRARGGGLLDSISFGMQLADLSVGRLANGQWALTVPTFGGANVAAQVGDFGPLKINEWLAAGVSPFPEDFIELHNPTPFPVGLGGLHLTDEPIGAPTLHRIAPLSFIAGFGYNVLIADGQPGAGPNHAGFKLSSDQGVIGLTGPGGALIDCVVYGPQGVGRSQGRTPNGSNLFAFFNQPTPGAGNPQVFVPPPPQLISLVAITNLWRFEESGVDLGTDWIEPAYDDAAWPAGRALLYVENAPLPAPKSTPLTIGRLTYYFRSSFAFNTNMAATGLQLNTVLDDGAVVYLNGSEIYRVGLPGGPVNYNTAANRSVGDAAFEGPVQLPLSGLVDGSNVLAVEVHQNALSSSDVVFGLTLDAVVITNTAAPGVVVLNEILANNLSLLEGDGSAPDLVELYNGSVVPVNLSDMSLSDAVGSPRRYVFPPGSSIPAQGYRLLRFDGNAPASATNTGFGLSAGGDGLFLFGALASGGALLDSITFGIQAADWSIGRVPSGGTNWQLNVPTLGAMNVAAALGNPALLKVNEWMASPGTGAGDDWMEIYNPNPQPVELSGLWLSDHLINRTKYRLPPLSFIGAEVAGYHRFSLSTELTAFALAAGGESLALSTGAGALIDGLSFGAQQTGVSQGRLPDGGAEVVSFPTSATPGESNFLPLTDVVVSEVLSHSDAPLEDAIELRNVSAAPVAIGGWFLSDSKTVLQKFQVPAGTILPAGGFKVYYENQFNAIPGDPLSFSLNSAKGDQVHLSAASAGGALTGYRSSVSFGAVENGVSLGRYATSVGVDFVALSRRTFGVDAPDTLAQFRLGTGLPNAYPRVGPVIISEIMYHPPDNGTNDNVVDEFIELHNITANAMPLYHASYPSNVWRLRDGVSFNFPLNTSIPAGGYLLVVSFDPGADPATLAAFRSRYSLSAAVPVVGPFSGKLDNSGESIELQKPDAPQLAPDPDAGFVPYVLVERVAYLDRAPWPVGADGFGLSLQRISPDEYGNDPANWMGATPTPGPSNSQDSDGDGMPDQWETAHGLNPNNAADASLDPDGDRMTNLQEYLADTDPQDAGSALRIQIMSAGPALLQFNAAQGKSYTIEHRDALHTGAWARLTNVAAGPARLVQVTDPSVSSTKFYRLRTPQSP